MKALLHNTLENLNLPSNSNPNNNILNSSFPQYISQNYQGDINWSP